MITIPEAGAVPAPTTHYRVQHITDYRYDGQIDDSYGRTFLTPRNTAFQQVFSTEITYAPEPEDSSSHTDLYGNTTAYFHIEAPHNHLTVTATSLVSVTRPTYAASALQRAWEDAVNLDRLDVHDGEPLPMEFVLPSARISFSDGVRELAARAFTPGRPMGEALADLTSIIHGDFTYKSGSTTVNTTLAELLEQRRGVCQDFAHLAVACARSVGLPARYVSGYLRTFPPPGKPRMVGADASHAWASVLVPGAGWVDIDPTNNTFADNRFITTAWGRDYSDVPPLAGVVFSDGAKSGLTVSVDVAEVDPAVRVSAAEDA